MKDRHYLDVTVGIPFYSKTDIEQLKLAVDSIINQTLHPQEIHLIQDGYVSPELEKFVKQYLQNNVNIKHFMIPENQGLAHALNLSILNTRTNYYARMDSDDIAHPERLEKQFEFLENHADIAILGTWAIEFEDQPDLENGFIRKVPTEMSKIRELFHYRNPLIHPTVMFRCSVFSRLGLYNILFQKEEDLELWSRALKLNIGISNIPETLMYYRFTDSVQRRSDALPYQIKARYNYNTLSPKLNLLKLISLAFRLLPYPVQNFAYQKLR